MVERAGSLYGFPGSLWELVPEPQRAALFETALERTVATTAATRRELPLPSGAKLTAWTSDDHTVSTFALAAEKLLPADPRWGALVAAPRSQMAIAYALGDERAFPALCNLALMAKGIFEEGPDPRVSPRIWWVRGGHCEPIDVEVDPQAHKVGRVSPSKRFAEEVLLPLSGAHLRPVDSLKH